MLMILTSCQKNEISTSNAAPSTLEMANILAQMASNAVPMENYHLNSQRAAILKPQYDNAPNLNAKISIGFKYLQEQLYAGENDIVIQEVFNLLQLIGGYDNALNQQSKPLYDMLGIAYMRKGEQRNCIENHTSASCIVPLTAEGFHKYPEGSQNAINVYTKILNTFPDDYQSRWLLNVAHMTLGQYPDGVPEFWRMPMQTFQSANQSMKPFNDIAIPMGLDVTGLSGGCNIEDFNGDGLLDIFATSYGMTDQVRLFINNGNGGFDDFTEKSGLTGIVGGLNTNHVDYDNDGDQDILILRGGWLDLGGKLPNSLLQNQGDGTFIDVTQAAGLMTYHPTQTAAWADFNHDGWLDLFIGNESKDEAHPCELFVSNGDGTFTEMSKQLGITTVGYIKGVAWGDVNNDQLPDLYISNLTGNNFLYMNRGGTSLTDWKFEEVAAKAGVQQPKYSFPTWFWDYDNDGDQDIFVAGYDMERLQLVGQDAAMEYAGFSPQGETPRLYQNNGDETFTDVTEKMGLNKVMYAMGCNFGDLDNDGFLDFYIGTGAPDFRSIVPNRMFRNVNGQGFEEVTMSGFGHIQKGHGVGFGDLDNDGDQDIYCVMGGALEADVAQNILFENHNSDNHWINIQLECNSLNKSGYGSVIVVKTTNENGESRSFYQTVNTGASFGASSIQQEIGLGKAKSIDEIEIRWASSKLKPSVYKNVNLNSFIKIKEGVSEVEYLNRKAFKMKGEHAGHHH